VNEHEAFAVLVKRDPQWLARPIEELVKMAAIGSVYVTTHRSLLAKIKAGQIGLAEEDRKTKLGEGQVIGEALLDVERKLGELFEVAPEADRPGRPALRAGPTKRDLKSAGGGADRFRVATAIARHPEAVAHVIAEAKRNEDIPTKTAVLQRIRLDHLEKNVGKLEKAEKDISEVALILIRELGDVVAKLPALWREKQYLPEALQKSIVDAIEKLYAIVEAKA